MTTSLKRTKLKRAALSFASVIALSTGLALSPAIAQEAQASELKIESQPLDDAINAIADQTGAQIVLHSDDANGVTTPALEGVYTPEQALEVLLDGTGLECRRVNERTIAVGTPARFASARDASLSNSESFQTALLQDAPARRNVERVEESQGEEVEDDLMVADTIVVTGTNIRGIAPESSPTIVFDRAAIDATGFQSTEELLRSVPQVFGGGATSLTSRLPDSEGNVSNGTGVNLRGLGGGSTLVLLNGKRFAPSGLFGSFVDVSSIPLNAVERIDILTDGASSIYGADAVGGVINFQLKDDFDGAETSLSYASSTESGRTRFVGSQTLGRNWESGNGLISYEFSDESELFADERDFAANAPDPLSLMPGRERHSVIGVLNQNLNENVEVSLNAYYATADSSFTINTGGQINALFETESNVEQLLISPAVSYEFSNGWLAELSGSYAETTDETDTFFPESGNSTNRVNEGSQFSFDLVANGPIFSLPGGDVLAAIGAGYRDEAFSTNFLTNNTGDITRDVYALFGEVYVPLVAEHTSVPLIRRLELNASARYEDYSDFGDTVNPKIGLLWSPLAGFNLRGSYGTSFSPPDLGNVGNPDLFAITANLADPLSTSGTTPTLLLLNGIDQDLQPEESENFTFGFDYSASGDFGRFTAKTTYYDIDFTDRVGRVPAPVGGLLNTLNRRDDVPDGVIINDPSDALITASIDRANATIGFLDLSGGTIAIPDGVGVVLDYSNRNLASVETNGIDFEVLYESETEIGALSFGLQGDYILSFDEQLSEQSPVIETVDTIFNPASLRLRGSFGLNRNNFSANAFLNYTTGYDDDRFDPIDSISSFTTLDATFSYSFSGRSDGDLLSGSTIALSVLNVFDQDPPAVRSDAGALGQSAAAYDPVNASPLGRFVSLRATKSF